MKIIAMTGLAAAACLAATLAIAQNAVPAADAVPPKVISTCQACHGPAGNSTSTGVPRLNGQHAEYISARLQAFRYPANQDPHATAVMWDVVSGTDDPTLAAIALYYERQTPTQPQTGRPLAAEGKLIYANGDPAEFIPACQGCHGANAEGHGTIPRLAGQHAGYLKNQLERLRLGLRASDTMHPKTINMTDPQIAALVEYLAKD